MNKTKHWDDIYANRPANEVGWYTPHLQTSLGWIEDLDLAKDAPLIDVGGGASTLVDDLVEAGYSNITVLDISAPALRLAQARLGNASGKVSWLRTDITETELPSRHYRLWHDRAVFHFLIDQESRQRYTNTLLDALKVGGYCIIGAFAPDAPPRCSGLPVRRYTAESLTATLGKGFELRRRASEVHVTPAGVIQPYVYCLFERTT